MSILKTCFKFACLAATLVMTIKWTCTYLEDEDATQIDLKPFEFPANQLPMLSVCLLDPISELKLREYNDTMTLSQYIHLWKEGYYDIANEIDFDSISINSTDFYIGYVTKFRNGSTMIHRSPHFIHEFPRVTYTGFHGAGFFKCFGLQSMQTKALFVMYGFNQSTFPDKHEHFSSRGFIVFLHMPRQLLSAGRYVKYIFPKRKNKQEYVMTFNLQHFELLRRRNKQKDPCIPFEENFDQTILDDHLDNVGCKAVFHKSNKSMKLCNTKQEITEAAIDLIAIRKSKKACTSAAMITFAYEESDHNILGADLFWVQIIFPDQYKEIRMIKDVLPETLIASIGGHVGLFLGT